MSTHERGRMGRAGKIMATLLIFMATGIAAEAQQIVETTPKILQNDSKNVTLVYHADQGNRQLMGLTASSPIYAHIGVITNMSNGNWAYAPTWGNNAAKYRLSYVSTNTWQLNIGDIRTYFGITNANEQVEKIAVVFRNANNSLEGKTADGGDIFIDVLPSGFQLSLTSDRQNMVVDASTSRVSFTAATTTPADIALYIGATSSTPIAETSQSTELTTTYTLSAGTDYTFIAKAKTSAGETATDTLKMCYPGASPQAPYPGGTPVLGARANNDGTVTFCLAAPQKETAMIVGAWDNYVPSAKRVMNRCDIDGIRYFWTTVSGLDSDTEYPYYYVVDNTYNIGDPYARLVLDPYSDRWLSDGTYPGLIEYPTGKVPQNTMLAVYKGTRDKYAWLVDKFTGPAQSDLIIYELLLRDFTGTEGAANGNGTLAQAMEKLPYLAHLGVNAIELMPIQEFNGNNSWGYNTNFYFAPDKAYGSPEMYREFIDTCHSMGMAVILDVVFNQSDGLHPWYQLYPSGSNPFYNARAPHAYSVLNDWRQDNMLVQQQWEDMIRYWMTAYKVDGFRLDLVKGLGNNDSYGGNASEANTNRYNASRVERMKHLTEVMHEINPNSYSINENLAGAQEENEMAANGQMNWANINDAACQFAMGYQSESNLNRFYAPNDSRTWGSTVSYAESHDEQRVAYKQNMYGISGVKGNLAMSTRRLGSLAAQMLLAPGAHMIWQFEELGNATSTKNADGSNNTDPKPVLWSYFDNPYRRGLYENYSELIGIRGGNPDLFAEGATFVMNCNTTNWAAGRTIYASTSDKELICVINPTTARRTFSGINFKSTASEEYTVMSASYDTNPTFDAQRRTVTLDPGCYVVLTRGNVMGVDDAIADTASETVAMYTLSGMRMSDTNNLTPGIYIAIDNHGHATKMLVR